MSWTVFSVFEVQVSVSSNERYQPSLLWLSQHLHWHDFLRMKVNLDLLKRHVWNHCVVPETSSSASRLGSYIRVESRSTWECVDVRSYSFQREFFYSLNLNNQWAVIGRWCRNRTTAQTSKYRLNHDLVSCNDKTNTAISNKPWNESIYCLLKEHSDSISQSSSDRERVLNEIASPHHLSTDQSQLQSVKQKNLFFYFYFNHMSSCSTFALNIATEFDVPSFRANRINIFVQMKPFCELLDL